MAKSTSKKVIFENNEKEIHDSYFLWFNFTVCGNEKNKEIVYCTLLQYTIIGLKKKKKKERLLICGIII